MAEKKNGKTEQKNDVKKSEIKKYILPVAGIVLVLALGIIIGLVLGKGSDKENSSENIVAENDAITSAPSGSKNSETGESDKNTEDIVNTDDKSVDDNKVDDSKSDDENTEDIGTTETDNSETGENETDNTETGKSDTGKTDEKNAEDSKADDKDTQETGKTETGKNETGKTETGNTETGKTEKDNTETGKSDTGKTDDKNTEDNGLDDKDTQETGKSETGKTETGKTENGSDDSYTLTYTIDNSWQDGSTNMFGMQMGITNGTKNAISGWKLVLTIEGLSTITGWNGTFSQNKETLTITDAGYNSDIYAGGTVVIGCNLGTTSKTVKITKATINGKDMKIVSGKVDQNDPGIRNDNNGGSGNGSSDNGSSDNGNKDAGDIIDEVKKNTKGVQGDDWLYTDGKDILDKDGKKVWITGLNWFGYNTGTNTFDGLWNSQLVPTVKAIADHGFNLIRVPISAELINQWAAGEYPRANYNNAYNTELNSMNSLEIFDYFLALAEENGIKVMPDIHSAETNASGHNVNLWYTDRVKVNDYYHALEWMAERYADNDTIIAFDLKNEPHGKPYEGDGAAIWNDSKAANNWKYVAETAAAKILKKNPNVLIMVEGIEIYPKDLKNNSDYHSTNDKDYYFNWWGGNLRGVADYPVDLGKYQNKLVYSPHDYGPTVYEQPWFTGTYTYDSLMKDCWKDNWFFIYEKNIAPLLIGEWGGFMTEPNITWMTYMRQLIKKYHLNHTFWCLNANSGDTGGLLLDDFKTWDDEKYKFVKEVLWQEGGKFVGLDHAIPLGDNGITLKAAKGLS